VGYTNAGKSTLLNALTDADVRVENRLFATLDPRTRRMVLPGGETVLCSDTVGFVRKLPHQLVESFHATLEVVADADLLVHVVDASVADPIGQMDAVRQVLGEIEAASVPELVVFNKADRAPGSARGLQLRYPGSVICSAATHEGLDDVVAAIASALRAGESNVSLAVPYERGDVLAGLHRFGEVLSQRDADGRLELVVRLDDSGRRRFAQFVTSDAPARNGEDEGSRQ
jgi:GTP-binding protein HflX